MTAKHFALHVLVTLLYSHHTILSLGSGASSETIGVIPRPIVPAHSQHKHDLPYQSHAPPNVSPNASDVPEQFILPTLPDNPFNETIVPVNQSVIHLPSTSSTQVVYMFDHVLTTYTYTTTFESSTHASLPCQKVPVSKQHLVEMDVTDLGLSNPLSKVGVRIYVYNIWLALRSVISSFGLDLRIFVVSSYRNLGNESHGFENEPVKNETENESENQFIYMNPPRELNVHMMTPHDDPTTISTTIPL